MSRVKQQIEKEQQTAPGDAAATTQKTGLIAEPDDEKAAAAMTHAEYEALERTIDYHMDRYYNQDAPEIHAGLAHAEDRRHSEAGGWRQGHT